MLRFLRYLFTRRIRLEGLYVSSAQAEQINERTRKGREFEQEVERIKYTGAERAASDVARPLPCMCPDCCRNFGIKAEPVSYPGTVTTRPLTDAEYAEQTRRERAAQVRAIEAAPDGAFLPITAELLGLEPRRRRAWGDVPSFVPPADNSPAFWFVRRERNGIDEGLGDHLSEPGPQWDCMNPAHDRCYAWWHRRRTPATPRAGQRVRADVPPSVGSYQPVTTIDPDAQNPV